MELASGFYSSPRWSWEILDCAMPMTFDTYSNCAHQCVYCFAYFQRAIGNTAKDYLSHQVKSVNVDKVKRLFLLDPEIVGKGTYQQFAWYIQNRYVLQWGGLSDGFDWYERKFRKSLELLKFFVEINYPVSISTKGVWFVYDDEYRAVLKNAKNVHFKYSIITDDAQKAKKLEAGCPAPHARMNAMEELNKLGIGATTLRFRPFIIGVSEHSIDPLFEQARDAGCTSITTEFLCLEKRASDHHLARYRRIGDVTGMDMWDFYRKNSYSGSGLMRLNYDLKRPFIEQMQAKAAEVGLPLYVSDSHHKEVSPHAGCCGLPNKGVLSHYHKGQFAEAMVIAKREGRVHWSDIAQDAEGLKQIPFYAAEGYNQGSTGALAKNRYHTMFDYMHDIWNTPKSWSSPARYFGGVLIPGGLDAEGNVIYLYNAPFVERGERVESVAQLLSQQNETRKADGADLGHVAYPIFVLSKGRANTATTPGLLEASRLAYTLVVEPQDQEAYAEAFPNAELLVLSENDQGIVFARQFVLDYARQQGLLYYWQLDDNLHGFKHCTDGQQESVTARAALSGAESIHAQYAGVALLGLDYQQFAFRAVQPYSANRKAYCCVLTATDTHMNYRPEAEMKEDVDFVLQHLAAGWSTVLVHQWAMDKATMGKTTSGGLSAKYRDGLHNQAAEWIVQQWPQYAKLVSKSHGQDAQIAWAKFKHPLVPLALAGTHD